MGAIPIAILVLSKRATAGKWDVMEDPRGRLVHVEVELDDSPNAGAPVCSIPTKRMADAEFIVACINFVRQQIASQTEAA